jgi:peptide/nickel transport system permease protein
MKAITWTSIPSKIDPSPIGKAWAALRDSRATLFGLVLVLVLALSALAAPWLTRADPLETDPSNTFSQPSWQHPMGTDNIGRDVWARFLYGGRVSLLVGVVAMVISSTLGTLAGIASGYYGGWLDSILSWLAEVLMAFPGILLAMAVIAILGPGLMNVIVAVGIGSIPSFMRISRSTVLQARQLAYVEAAQAIGCRPARIMFRHILPNILRPLVMLATLGVGGAILDGAALSFLGLGAQPPSPEWGAMLSAGRGFLAQGWWISVFPGIGIFLTILGINLLGDGLNDVFDPHHRSSQSN